MQIKRNSTANWQGTGKDGKGQLSTQSGVLKNTPYGFNSRFAEGIGTNPEELIGAALAGCFTMKLAFNLQAKNLIPENIETNVTVILDNGSIPEIELATSVKVNGITTEEFNELVNDAKTNCPVSKLLNTKINLTSSLIAF
jgi:osmotically inducible protein OsmC